LPKSLSLLICVNPTAGLDLETKQWVWHEIKLRANSGIGVLIFSSEEEELMQNTHNIWLNKDQKWFEPFESESLLEILDQPLKNSDEDNYEAN
jgi:ABC-type sugar transport system ATPase subunit